ncbi:hypothetical protein D3C84_717630 [compost metagenome]
MRQGITGQLFTRDAQQSAEAIQGNHAENHGQANGHRAWNITLRVAGFFHQRADEFSPDKTPHRHRRQRDCAELQRVPTLIQWQLQTRLTVAQRRQAHCDENHHHYQRQHVLQPGEHINAEQVQDSEQPQHAVGHHHVRNDIGIDLADHQIQQQQFGGKRKHRHHHVARERRENRREMPDRHFGVTAEAARSRNHQGQLGKRPGVGDCQHVSDGQRNDETEPGNARALQHQHHHALRDHDAHRNGQQRAQPQDPAQPTGRRLDGRGCT